MGKYERNSKIALAALAVGAVFVGKLIHDIKKIKTLAEEKEAALAEEALEATEEVVEETAEVTE